MTKLGIQFVYGQIFATYLAMILNFYNNYFITYRNVHIPNSFVKNLMRFMVICSVGAWLNVFSAFYLNNLAVEWQVAGIFGVFVGSVWNYSISRYVIWKI